MIREYTIANPVLESYYNKIRHGLVAKAASYATVGRVITDSDLMEACRGNPPAYLSNNSVLYLTEPVYESTLKAFSSVKELKPCLKGTSVWKFNAYMLHKADDLEMVRKKIIELYSSLDAITSSRVMNAHSSKMQSKDEQIFFALLDAFDKVMDRKYLPTIDFVYAEDLCW